MEKSKDKVRIRTGQSHLERVVSYEEEKEIVSELIDGDFVMLFTCCSKIIQSGILPEILTC